MKLLLSKKADPNLVNILDMTAYEIASQAGNTMAENILEKHTDATHQAQRKTCYLNSITLLFSFLISSYSDFIFRDFVFISARSKDIATGHHRGIKTRSTHVFVIVDLLC